MTNPTLERVATALERQAWAALGTGDTLAYRNRRTSSLRKARKVIEALLQVDDSTVEAMCAVGPDTNSGCFSEDNALTVFTAAIQHILEEG